MLLRPLPSCITSRTLTPLHPCIHIQTLTTQTVLSRPDPWAGVLLWQPNLREALYAVSILVFGFNSSANTISIFSEVRAEFFLAGGH